MVYEPLYHALHIWPVENWKLAEIFSRRIEWHPKKIVLLLRILDNAISPGKQTKKPQEFVWKIIERTHENTWNSTKPWIPRPRKVFIFMSDEQAAVIVSSWSRSHSLITAACSSDIENINHMQLATNRGYAAIHYGNPGVIIASCLVQQNQLAASNNFITSLHEFLNGKRGSSFPFVTAQKN